MKIEKIVQRAIDFLNLSKTELLKYEYNIQSYNEYDLVTFYNKKMCKQIRLYPFQLKMKNDEWKTYLQNVNIISNKLTNSKNCYDKYKRTV